MVDPFITLAHEVERVRHTQVSKDVLGNEVFEETTEMVRVVGWAVPQSSEPKVAGHDRLTVAVELLAKTGDFAADDEVNLPGYGRLKVVGHPENYDHGPFGFTPGVEVVNLVREDR